MNLSGISRTPQMQALPKYTQSIKKAESDPNLYKVLAPPSEKADYSEQDALLNEYMKQYRIDYNIYEGSPSQTDEAVRLALPSQITPDELEAFRQTTGDEKKIQLGKLEELFHTAKQSIADTFANSIGGFYDEFMGENKSENMKKSLLSGIDSRVKEYQDYLTEHGNSVAADDWLLKDDGFMAARLRENMANANSNPAANPKSTETPESEYSLSALGVAGIFAKESMNQYNSVVSTLLPEDELTIGLDLALQSMKTDYMIHQTGVGANMASLLEKASESYRNKYLDKLDESLKNISQTVPAIKNKLDRDAIYGIFNYTKNKYHETGDISDALKAGVQFAQQQFRDGSTYSGNHGDKYKWENFVSGGQYGNNVTSEPPLLEKYQITINRVTDSLKSGDLRNINLVFSHGGRSLADRYDETMIYTYI